MHYYGYALSGMYYYYQCLNCQKYSEYHVTSKLLIVSQLVFLFILVTVVATYTMLVRSPDFAFSLFFGSIIMLLLVGYKYRWSGYEITVLDNLPSNRRIIRNHMRRSRFIALLFFSACLLIYLSVFVYNMLRQQ